MKTIKANDYYRAGGLSYVLEYEVNGKQFEVTGEFYYNKSRGRIEHTHEGPRGGEYLIYWNI